LVVITPSPVPEKQSVSAAWDALWSPGAFSSGSTPETNRGLSWSVAKRKKDVVSSLSVVHKDGIDSPIFTTKKFLLQGIEESRAEKYQIIETFGDTFIYLFDEQPKIFSCTGILLNAAAASTRQELSSNWVEQFDVLYDIYLRGYKAASQQFLVRLQYENYIRIGVLLNFTKRHFADANEGIPFQMSLYVTNMWNSNYSPVDPSTEQLSESTTESAISTESPPPPDLKGSLVAAANASTLGLYAYKDGTMGEPLFGAIDLD